MLGKLFQSIQKAVAQTHNTYAKPQPSQNEPLDLLLQKQRSYVFATAEIEKKTVTKWPSPVPDKVFYECEFYEFSLNDTPCLLMCFDNRWHAFINCSLDLMKNKDFLMRSVYSMKKYYSSNNPFRSMQRRAHIGDTLKNRHLILIESLHFWSRRLHQQHKKIIAMGPIFYESPINSTILVEDENGTQNVWHLSWGKTQCTAKSISAPTETILYDPKIPNIEEQIKKQILDDNNQQKTVLSICGHPQCLEDQKTKTEAMYIHSLHGKHDQPILTPLTKEDVLAVIDTHGIIITDRSKILPRSAGKGRSRPHAYIEQTSAHIFCIKAFLSEGKKRVTVYFHHAPGEDAYFIQFELEVEGYNRLPSLKDIEDLTKIVLKSIEAIPLLQNRIASTMIDFSNAVKKREAVIAEDIKNILLGKCKPYWEKAKIEKEKNDFIKSIPDGSLIALKIASYGPGVPNQKQWTIKNGNRMQYPFLFLADDTCFPTIEDVESLKNFPDISAHERLQRAIILQDLERYICRDSRFESLRACNREETKYETVFQKEFFELLKKFDPEKDKKTDQKFVYAFERSHLYYQYDFHPYNAYQMPDNLEKIKWELPKFKNQKKIKTDLFLHKETHLLCSVKAKKTIEKLNASSVTFWPITNVPDMFYVQVEADKDDLYWHDLMKNITAQSGHCYSLGTWNTLEIGLQAKPEATEGQDIWRSRFVKRENQYEHIFLFSERALEAFKKDKLKITPYVAIPVS